MTPTQELTQMAHDERIMGDGRPAFAWYNELMILRREAATLKQCSQDARALMMLLGATVSQIRVHETMTTKWTVELADNVLIRLMFSPNLNERLGPYLTVKRLPIKPSERER